MNASNAQHEDLLREALKNAKPGSKAHSKLKAEYHRVYTYNHGEAPPQAKRTWRNHAGEHGRKAREGARKAAAGPRGAFRDAERNFHESRRDHTQTPNYGAGTSIILGDRKRARHQDWGRRARTAGGKMHGAAGVAKQFGNHVKAHPAGYATAAAVGAVGYGVYKAHKYKHREADIRENKQTGPVSNKNRRNIRKGAVAIGAGGGFLYGYASTRSRGMSKGSAAVVGGFSAVGGGLGGYVGDRIASPNNKPGQKEWTIYRRTRNGKVETVKRRTRGKGFGKRPPAPRKRLFGRGK